ncbi:unnamed protein product, partial [Brassica oleracea var. botrytis]
SRPNETTYKVSRSGASVCLERLGGGDREAVATKRVKWKTVAMKRFGEMTMVETTRTLTQ